MRPTTQSAHCHTARSDVRYRARIRSSYDGEDAVFVTSPVASVRHWETGAVMKNEIMLLEQGIIRRMGVLSLALHKSLDAESADVPPTEKARKLHETLRTLRAALDSACAAISNTDVLAD